MFRSVIGQPRSLLVLLALYWLVMVIGTHLPEPHVPHIVDMQDKLVHAGAYAFLTLLLWLFWRSASSPIRPMFYVMLTLCMAVHAAADELTQHFVAGRSPDLLDWTADMGGVLLALLLAEAVFRRFSGRAWIGSSASADAAG